ncbi:MAG: TIGR03016 family PEP-CTERM system-associated outer membrane protein, partial [Burkholderiaceae bacterium]
GNPAGRFWMSGFSWAPTDRTSISASGGKRFYGSTYALSSSVRSRTTIWSLNYSEDITTAQSQLAGQSTVDQIFTSLYPNDDLSTHQSRINGLINSNPQANLNPNTILPNSFFSNRVFLQKKLQGLATLNSGKSAFILSGYYAVRTGQTTLAIDNGLYGTLSSLADKTKEAGASAQWNWKIYSRTTANLGADYIRTSAPAVGGKSDTKRVTLSLTKQFQPKLDGSIGCRHVLQKSSQVVGKITEDAVFASLLMRF